VRDPGEVGGPGVVRAGLGRTKQRANESALIRIRTNEAVTGAGPWHLREFAITAARDSAGRLRYQNGKLVCSSGGVNYCVPRPTTVKQTPAGSWNGSKILSNFAFTYENEILNGTGDALPIGVLPAGGTSVLPRTLGLPRGIGAAAARMGEALARAHVVLHAPLTLPVRS